MELLPDDRAQSVQIGAVLLFGILIILLASWQAFVIPDQNEAIEFNHNQDVQQQMTEVRTTVNSMPDAAATRSATIDLGTRYPTRTIFRNPPPAAGTIETVGTTDSDYNVSIENATATDENVDDFWNGSLRRYDTGAIQYRPSYNLYASAPRTIYEHSVLYNKFERQGQDLSVTGQTLVRDDRITVVALNGTFRENRIDSTSVDFDPISTRTRTVEIENESHNVTLSAPTAMEEDEWQSVFEDEMTENGGNVLSVSTTEFVGSEEFSMLEVTLEPGNYSLKLAKVGVGTRTFGTAAEYLTGISGNGTTIQEDQTQKLVLEARDKYNKPISGVTVNGSAEDGSFTDSSTKTTNSEGRAVFEYEPSNATPKEKRLNFTIDSGYNPGGSHAPDSPRNVTMNVEVDAVSNGNSGSSTNSYSVEWLSPENDNSNAILSDCSETDCTWDVGAGDDVLTLDASAISTFERDGTRPKIDGADIDFAVDNSTIAGVSPNNATTDANGSALTNLTAKENGTIGVYAASGGTSDVINITVENVTSDRILASQIVSYVDGSGEQDGANGRVFFDLENTGDNNVQINEIVINSTTKSEAEKVDHDGDNEFEGGNGYINLDPGEIEIGAANPTPLDQIATIESGETVSFRLEEFRNNGGKSRNLVGEDVTITVFFTDGSNLTFTAENL